MYENGVLQGLKLLRPSQLDGAKEGMDGVVMRQESVQWPEVRVWCGCMPRVRCTVGR